MAIGCCPTGPSGTTCFLLIRFYENFGKRLIKSPKIYLADPGLACHLLGIDTTAELTKSLPSQFRLR